MNAQQLIALLNSLTFGDLAALASKLDQARAACAALGQDGIADLVSEARAALAAGDLKTYRKKLETAVARLGHVKNG